MMKLHQCAILAVFLQIVLIEAQQPMKSMNQPFGRWRAITQMDHHRGMGDRHRSGRSRRMGINLTGPNVCREKGSSFCCPGWALSHTGKMCLRPLCDEGRCGSGLCKAPNTCLCEDGKLKPACNMESAEQKCTVRCMHGGKCVNNQCQCTYGYTGPHCGQPICGPGCLNGGRCITPGRCACVYGFTGMRCERDYRKGPCFLTRVNNTCINEVQSVMCTKLYCCATVGQGWGTPCEECPARVGNCTKGRLPPHCTDINECEIMRGLCEGGTCVNTDGSFRCECPEGFEYNPETHQCQDTNECETDVCSGGTCVNTEGGFECQCPQNWKLSSDGTYCISDLPGRCYTEIESGMCAGPLASLRTRTQCCCVMVESGLETLGKCFAAIGQSPERCPAVGTPEFERDCKERVTTTPEDICEIMGVTACVHGTCVNLPEQESFYCECDEGYLPSENKRKCVDNDECKHPSGQLNEICGAHGTCMNTDGSYVCHCDDGFANQPGSMTSCVDIDECAQDGMCPNGICRNTMGSFRCQCSEGYRPTATNQACEDINECSEQQLCENGRCVNTGGSYQCICHPGFLASPDSTSCDDVDECENSGVCPNGECVNLAGRYKCMCNPGYKLLPNGQGCTDVNECDTNPCLNGECVNDNGGFSCKCHDYQVLDQSGLRCILNPTLGTCFRNVKNGQCAAADALDNLVTRAHCCCAVPGATSAFGDDCEPCPERSDPRFAILCSNVKLPNICDLMTSPCENGDCINLGNDFRCNCKKGFLISKDQKSCEDFDECSKNVCSNGNCRNTPGSYKCECHEGYVLSGDVCEDIDECLSNPCTRAQCINTPGGYKCVCGDGQELGANKHTCYDTKITARCWADYNDGECSSPVGDKAMTSYECCNTLGVAWGNGECVSCDDLENPCDPGYMPNPETEQCENINECDLGICKGDAQCVDTVGSFQCICPDGLTLDGSGTDCVDVRVGTCYAQSADCTGQTTSGQLMPKAKCCCSIGQSWDFEGSCEGCPAEGTPEHTKLCVSGEGIHEGPNNINECMLFPDLCGNGKCENSDGSFKCKCNQGFTTDESGKQCVDIDECFISPGVCGNGKCDNTNGDFRCICDEGYEESKMMKVCVDINECAKNGYCTGGTCLNTEGSYECVCPQGRSLNEEKTACVDVDECALQPMLCKPNGRCENMLGYYMCICDVGYAPTPNARDCVDIDECAVNNGGCHHTCTNTIGSYECSCDDGYVLAFDGHTCADRDECLEEQNRCDGGRCENIEGSFRCICFDGFMSTNDLQFCEDIDECAMNPNVCMHGKCHNTRGSYTCNCNPGYCVPQGQMICVDEDECEMSKHNCHVNADCENTEGGYECTCIAGFHGDGFMCHDDDECELGTHMCHEYATCTNKLGTYECNCIEGYHGDGFTCSDNDDCLEDESLCSPGQCVNVEGSFECDCPEGYATTADRKACKDIDECAFEHICVNGRCHNIPGSFRCDCLPGFQKDDQGANCTDIDECDQVEKCVNGVCVNTDGSYECQCPSGFEKNPSENGCVDNRIGDCFLTIEGDDNAPVCTNEVGIRVKKAHCCCAQPTAGWGNPCEKCPANNTEEYQTLCPGGVGFYLNPISVVLKDIDECVQLPGLCKGGSCLNLFGSYVCQCKEGYDLNAVTRACEDVDECAADIDVCGAGECINTVGGFNCVCPEGWKSTMGGRKCEDIRVAVCHRYYNDTSGECTSTLPFEDTKFKCCCYDNIAEAWNDPCEPCPKAGTDEWTELCGKNGPPTGEGVCSQFPQLCANGICMDVGNTHRCECQAGYEYNDDLLVCEDIDECLDDDLCIQDSECQNLPGSYRCACKEGFVLDEETDSCIDVDECAEIGACANGDCTNGHGGFQCDCNQGFVPVNDGKACEDINECENNPCGAGVCHNNYGGFTCACDTGYEVSANGDCVDIDECSEDDQCKNGVCVNTLGGFTCDCNDGYFVAPDGRSCIDINECQAASNVCGAGTCQNMDGSYKCYCPDGYASDDGKSCTDINECEEPDMCREGTCVNTEGGFKCICPDGFELSGNKKFCVDIRIGTCYNAPDCAEGSSTDTTRSTCCCQCNDNSWAIGDECETCPDQDSDEFAQLCPNGCGLTPGGLDIDECKNKPCIGGTCKNTPGSFKCECPPGLQLDASGVNCVDVDDCANGNPCGAGVCTNTDGAFECDCDEGYYNGPEMTCLDLDECQENLGLNTCRFRCVNTDGGYECACPQGYQLKQDGNMCEDIDECASDDLNDCDENGMTCRNMIGHYICLCPPGYRRLGAANTCVDVNECEQNRVCANGRCTNLEGTYRCECNDGYNYDEENKLCLDTRQGLCYAAVHQRNCEVTSTTGLPFTKAECCCNRGKGWGDDCEECPHPGTAAFMELCPHGPGFGPNGEDVDDCRVLPALCTHGTCINTLGSFRCACDHGYEPSPSKQMCLDVNECVRTPSPCSFDCRNTMGGYECVCPAGYQLDRDNSACVDLDECVTKQHNCQYLCINTVGSFKCECPHGFVEEGQQCVDRNECLDTPNICGGRGICRNDPGGYHCECPRGYRLDDGRGTCTDIDECGARSGCSGSCQNVPGSYRCLCGRGFRSNLYGRGCQDVDECMGSPCGMGQMCQNTVGSFECGCSSGLMKTRRGCGDVDECSIGRGSCNFGCSNQYGGFACGCPMGSFRAGSGHCIGGQFGFQQQVPNFGYNYGMPPPSYGAFPPQTDTVCFKCMPGGDSKRRARRDVDSAASFAGRFIEVSDRQKLAYINTSLPIEIYVKASQLAQTRIPLVELRPALKQLRNNVRYHIVSGNDERYFRMHRRSKFSVLHSSQRNLADGEQIPMGVYRMSLQGRNTLSDDKIKQSSFNSPTIEQAIRETLTLDVIIHVEEE